MFWDIHYFPFTLDYTIHDPNVNGQRQANSLKYVVIKLYVYFLTVKPHKSQ